MIHPITCGVTKMIPFVIVSFQLVFVQVAHTADVANYRLMHGQAHIYNRGPG